MDMPSYFEFICECSLITLVWIPLGGTVLERCGYQRCQKGYSYCLDKRCRSCSDFDNTEYGCYNTQTLSKCYKYCLEKFQIEKITREKLLNQTWQSRMDMMNETRYSLRMDSELNQFLNKTDQIIGNQHPPSNYSSSILQVIIVTLFFVTVVIFWFVLIHLRYKSRRWKEKKMSNPEDIDVQKKEAAETNTDVKEESANNPSLSTATEMSSLLGSLDLSDETASKLPNDHYTSTYTQDIQDERELLRCVPVQDEVNKRFQGEADCTCRAHETSRLVTSTSDYSSS